jgi:hypothetical protein
MKGTRKKGKVIKGAVNISTTGFALTIPMRGMRKVLLQLFQLMADTPASQEIFISKVDLSDGFWGILLEDESSGISVMCCWICQEPLYGWW